MCLNNLTLVSIDVSGLTSLEILWIGQSQLTSLDVSGLTNLRSIIAGNGKIASLDVSGLINLESLTVPENQLTSLDVLGLTNLVNLSVHSNQLTSLNVSGLTNLERLFCQNNHLTSLDLTGLDNLTAVNGSGQSVALTLSVVNDNYSVEIELNNPTNLVGGLSYLNGTLTSTSNTIISSPFRVETGHSNPNFTLSGTLTLNYKTETNIKEIKNENRQAVAFYTITGIKLHTEPQSGIFIILYDDGTSEKVMR